PYVIVKGLARRYALKLSGMALAHVKYEGLQQFASPRIASYPAVREPASQGSLPALEDPYKKQEEGVKGHSCWPVLMKHTLLSSGPPHPALLAVPRTYSGSMALPAGHGRATRGRTGVGTVSRKVALRHRTSPSLLPAAPALPLRPKAALADAQARKPAFITRTAVPLSRRFEGGLNQKKGLTRQSSQVMPPEPGLVMQPHQHLSHVLRHYLAARGVSLVWQVPGDFELLQSWTVPGHSQQQVILRALNQFNLEGTLYARNRTLVVTPSSGFGRGQGG
ncbi:MAG: hypothetical protein KGL58_07185, partial [Pseudomonadota bacterium]|nr:hypothetical protein [Pseudomonadota bacterium]